jgi:MFS family permease
MPKPLSAVDCIGPAFARTKRQLFAPFRFERWARLALVCLITADFAGGGGGFNYSWHRHSGGNTLIDLSPVDQCFLHSILPWIVAGSVLMLLFIILWMYAASVYRFVLFDSVLYDRCKLKGSWRRWEPRGRSYFFWRLSLCLAFFIGLLLLIGAPIGIAWGTGLFNHPREHLAALILGGGVLLIVFLAFVVATAIAAIFAKDFCVPFMALENLGVLDAWRRLLPKLGAEKLAYTGYVLMKIVLAVGSAVIFGIITLLALIALAIPLVIAGVVIFFAGKAAGLTLNPIVIANLVIVGGIILAGVLYLIAFIRTPVMVFFQSYVLHFFGGRYAPLGAIVSPPSPEPQPSPSPTEAPAPELPPTPAPVG